MKMKAILALVTMTTLVFLSCETDKTESPTDQQTDLTQSIALEAAVEEAERIADGSIFFGSNFQIGQGLTGKGPIDIESFNNDCISISSESLEEVTTIVLTYSDDQSCADDDGNNVSGTLKISITDLPNDANGTITYEDFTVNGYILNGTKTFDVVDSNANGNTEVSLVVDITVQTDDRTITKKGSRLVEQTAGGETDTNEDDVFEMTGSSTYSDTLGNTFTVEIVSPLIKSAGCHYITEGIKHYTDNDELSILDYGDGSCDSVATLTKPDGSVVEIELRYRGKGSIHVD